MHRIIGAYVHRRRGAAGSTGAEVQRCRFADVQMCRGGAGAEVVQVQVQSCKGAKVQRYRGAEVQRLFCAEIHMCM